MGKGTDKLYITHSEWSSEDAFGASAGANARKTGIPNANFKRLPFNYCALSLQPFQHPVCTADGTIFDLTHILPWLKKHRTNPVDGQPLASSELIKLNFASNDQGDYVDPVTFNVFTDHTHLAALRNTGNVFAWDTLQRLNIKAKNWRDLLTDEEFKRSDIITLQDPQNVAARDLSQFKYLRDGVSVPSPAPQTEGGTSAKEDKILQAKAAVAKARADRGSQAVARQPHSSSDPNDSQSAISDRKSFRTTKPVPYNAAQYTTGQAAASFTSTGLTPTTSGDRAILSDEEYMLKPRRVKLKGYARLSTTAGDLTLELYPEFAPKAVWNFVQLSKRNYYNGLSFHRNIRSFMLQGGDPTGTGRGGQSCWGTQFADELEGPLAHDARGVLSMANKGKDTNTSQFFLTYRALPHLDRKHTVFGRVVDGLDVLTRLENTETGEKDRPVGPCGIENITVYVDPFDEFLRQRSEAEASEARRERIRREGGAEDEKTTWTGKRIRADGRVETSEDGGGVGKYLKQAATAAASKGGGADEVVGDWTEPEAPRPVKKAKKGLGGFGNFEGW